MLKKIQSSTITADSILNENTLYPCFFSFMSERNVCSIIQKVKYCKGYEGTEVSQLEGNKYRRNISKFVRYCPNCMENDENIHGCSYIHREHQFAFIEKCLIHSAKLVTHCSECNIELSFSGIDGKCRNGHAVKHDESIMAYDYAPIYDDLIYLLGNSHLINRSLIKLRYMEYLNNRGYLTVSGKVRQTIFLKHFLEYYSMEVLLSMGVNVEHFSKKRSLEFFFHGDSFVIDLPMILLVIRFLGGSLEKFITESKPYKCKLPFGIGPWSCENKYCPQYKQKVIQRCFRKMNNNGGVTARFHCEYCETVYRKEFRSRSRTVGKFVHLEYSEKKRGLARSLIEKGISIHEISLQLYCSPTYIEKLNKEFQYAQSIMLRSIAETAVICESTVDLKRDHYREILKAVRRENQGITRTGVKLKIKSGYEWLKKHDCEWLEENLPPKETNPNLDFKQLDTRLSLLIVDVLRQLLASNIRTRICRNSILGGLTKIDKNRIYHHLERLPKTDQALIEYVDTLESYQLRHLPILVDQLRRRYKKEPKLETVLRYRKFYYGISEEMKGLIADRLTLMKLEKINNT